jgi:uncharacterized protein YegP (UPF0339 family)
MINAIAHPVQVYKTITWYLKPEWRWRITANNGKVIAASSEGYRNRVDLISNMASITASLGEFITEEEGGINYSHAKLTLNRNKND